MPQEPNRRRWSIALVTVLGVGMIGGWYAETPRLELRVKDDINEEVRALAFPTRGGQGECTKVTLVRKSWSTFSGIAVFGNGHREAISVTAEHGFLYPLIGGSVEWTMGP